MTNPLSRKDKLLSSFVIAFLILSGGSAAQPGRLSGSFCAKYNIPNTTVSIVAPGPTGSSALPVSPPQTTVDNSSRFIHTEKNSDLVISIPDAASKSYKVIFFDGDHLLFELNVPAESYLILEKNNFRHAGLYRYELFRDDALVEKNIFILKND